MKKLFENLDIIEYSFDKKIFTIRNIFDINKSMDNVYKYINNLTYYLIHEIKEGEKWETIAKTYYGNSNLHLFWIFIIMNNVEDLFYDFALTIDELGKSTLYTEETSQITYELFEKAINKNDEKRFIKILKKEYINDFEKDFFNI